jgi:quercetin dioxygenase-like cupin family protein
MAYPEPQALDNFGNLPMFGRDWSGGREGRILLVQQDHEAGDSPMAKVEQKLLVKHLETTQWVDGGEMRPQFEYRELGVDEATGGAYNAHIIRGGKSKKAISEHKHTEMDFLFVYVLKGWVKFDYVGHGEHTLKAGSCHIIPPGLSHSVIAWSDDLEMLELTSPAHYKTTDTVNGKEVAPAKEHLAA